MSAIITVCLQCGMEFEPDHDAILAGTWRVCPACRTATAPESRAAESRCEQCGRVLHAGKRTICLGCLLGAPSL